MSGLKGRRNKEMNSFENIPKELKEIPNWIICKLEKDKDGKFTKVPYQINNKYKAKSNDSSTWTTYEAVKKAYENSDNYYNGIGFELELKNGFVVIDLDACIDKDEKIEDYAQSIINETDSYVEKSQSGQGFHIMIKGTIPRNMKRKIEMYSTDRFIVMTGDIYNGKNKINENQSALDTIYKKYKKPETIKSLTATREHETKKIIDCDDLLRKAFKSGKGSKIKALYDGDTSDYSDNKSDADEALCFYLAFWLDRNYEAIDSTFRKSALYREGKWNAVHYADGTKYGENTINEAIEKVKETVQEYWQKNNIIDFDNPPDYLYKNNRGKLSVNTGLLAKHIREHNDYMIVRKQGYDNDFLYCYDEEGYYRKSSPNEFKGKIKKYIPESIRKPNQFEDTYKDLITDKTSIKFEELNNVRQYINVKNGLYNVKTKTLEQHNPQVKSTIQLNCGYDPSAAAPVEWLKYLNMLADGDKNTICILQEWLGLTLSNIPGSITKKCLALYGTLGNTGKTQYGRMIIYLLNNENVCSTAIQDFSKTFATGDLFGTKAIVIDDQKSISIDDSSTFKSMTGGGFIRCEIKGKQAFSYIFNGTLMFSCNDMPYFKGDKGDHVFERFIIVPCNNVIPENKRIGDILEHFKPEADGIFQWAITGLNRLIENNYKFTDSELCNLELEQYRFANDSLYKFIKESYIITNDKKDRIKKTLFETDYENYAFKEDIQGLEKKNILARVKKHGICYGKIQGQWFYKGIKKKLSAQEEKYSSFLG